ncbi:hypothetical protein ACE6H2_000087 [Prunus campanulata]
MDVGLRMSSSQVLEWASLPLPVLFLVLDRLLEPIDHIRFAAVCKEWCVLAKEYNHKTQRWRKLLPMLLVPTECEGKRKLYSFPAGKIYDIELPVPCNSKRYCDSSHGHGWLATMDVLDRGGLTITLVNPFRKVVAPIRLPRLDFKVLRKYCEVCLPKIILSEDPTLNPDSYVVVAIYKHVSELAFTKGGQKFWIYSKRLRGCLLTDAIFHKSQVFAVGKWGNILSFDITSKPIDAKILNPQECPFSRYADKAYLVESTDGDLLHVRRFLKDVDRDAYHEEFWTERFMVYKLVFNEGDGSVVQHVEIKSIGDEVMFLGDNYCISVLASNFPGCQPNSIYYMDDCTKLGGARVPDTDSDSRPSDIGIFNLEDETITQHYSLNISPALWIVPLFNGLC